MKSIKCPNCGLVNFADRDVCKRCEAALNFSDTEKNTDHNDRANKAKEGEITRGWEIALGVGLSLLSLILIAMNWGSAEVRGKFYGTSTVLAPFALGLGLSMIIFPYKKKEYFPRLEHAPAGWTFLWFLGLVLGILNFLYFKGIIFNETKTVLKTRPAAISKQ